eukprot:Clim_evm1s169 gene=Clim_evmTU1s169
MLRKLFGIGKRNHRPISVADNKLMRAVGKPNEVLPLHLNPGIRIQRNFISPLEEEKLVAELHQVVNEYGLIKFNPDQEHFILSDNGTGQIDRTGELYTGRVTGRHEDADQITAPWGYADKFKKTEVPPMLYLVMTRLMQSKDFSLGKPRDISVNHRKGALFKLDPRCNPQEDGPNIFVLNLLSPLVITFSPLNPQRSQIRKDPAHICLKSWTDEDIDVLFQPRSLVHFTAEARSNWQHGIRVGVLADEPYNGICDWFGSVRNLVARHEERFSVVFTFGAPEH